MHRSVVRGDFLAMIFATAAVAAVATISEDFGQGVGGRVLLLSHANQSEPPVSRVKKPCVYHILSHLAATGPIFLFLLLAKARLQNNNNNGEP